MIFWRSNIFMQDSSKPLSVTSSKFVVCAVSPCQRTLMWRFSQYGSALKINKHGYEETMLVLVLIFMSYVTTPQTL